MDPEAEGWVMNRGAWSSSWLAAMVSPRVRVTSQGHREVILLMGVLIIL